ncbi:hypothetical protein F5144DRAFT_180562 [Chaetomium tenue]|uniref:Uncharacterized protein n=1 Tax=Chaetomium tenue TaxID=1854479 RepID=A0ACB7PDP0_9PEZI|nr:hypothetical protein F5144DRAFT_180562 [Chaetomium globosum]
MYLRTLTSIHAMACLSSSRLARDTKHKRKRKHAALRGMYSVHTLTPVCCCLGTATDPAEWTAARQVGDHWAMSDGEARAGCPRATWPGQRVACAEELLADAGHAGLHRKVLALPDLAERQRGQTMPDQTAQLEISPGSSLWMTGSHRLARSRSDCSQAACMHAACVHISPRPSTCWRTRRHVGCGSEVSGASSVQGCSRDPGHGVTGVVGLSGAGCTSVFGNGTAPLAAASGWC